MNDDLDPLLKRAIYHLLAVWDQYYAPDNAIAGYFPHRCMHAGEHAAAFLEELGLGVDDGFGLALNEKGMAIATDRSLDVIRN